MKYCIENYVPVKSNNFKAPLNLSPLKCTYLGKNHFNNISAKSEKMKLKGGHLELRFKVVNCSHLLTKTCYDIHILFIICFILCLYLCKTK